MLQEQGRDADFAEGSAAAGAVSFVDYRMIETVKKTHPWEHMPHSGSRHWVCLTQIVVCVCVCGCSVVINTLALACTCCLKSCV